MSDSNDGDLLMYFVLQEGSQPLKADSTSALRGNDARLMQGFIEGHYFEAENFSLGMELADDEGGSSMTDDDLGSYTRWRALRPNQPKPNPPFRAEPGDVSISRRIDSSSPVLLKTCLNKQQFSSAVLVKRARIGGTGMMSAVLRLEFSKVWVRSIDWEDGDTVRETCKFKYAAVKGTYVRRNPDGSVASLWPCEWNSVRAVGIHGY